MATAAGAAADDDDEIFRKKTCSTQGESLDKGNTK